MIVSYIKSIIKQQPGGSIIQNNFSLTCMKMIDPAMGWFKIVKILTYGLDDITGSNDEYRDKSSVRVSQLFDNTWLSRYPCPRTVMFDNEYEFKRDFTPLLNNFDIKPVLTTIKNPQYNAPVEQVYQVILNMLVTKDLDNKVFNNIDPWDEALTYIAWEMMAPYHRNIQATPGQAVFGI